MPSFLSALISNCPKVEQISPIDKTHVHQSCTEITIPSTCLRLAVNAKLLTNRRLTRNLNELIVDASSLEDFFVCNEFLWQNLSLLNFQNFGLRMTEFEPLRALAQYPIKSLSLRCLRCGIGTHCQSLFVISEC